MRLLKLLLPLLLTGCCKTEILNAPQPLPLDTIVVSKAKADTTEQADTARAPIGWNPSVEDWTNINQDLID